MTDAELYYTLHGQFEAPKTKRSKTEILEYTSQLRAPKLGIAPPGEVQVNQDPSYHKRKFKR